MARPYTWSECNGCLITHPDNEFRAWAIDDELNKSLLMSFLKKNMSVPIGNLYSEFNMYGCCLFIIQVTSFCCLSNYSSLLSKQRNTSLVA